MLVNAGGSRLVQVGPSSRDRQQADLYSSGKLKQAKRRVSFGSIDPERIFNQLQPHHQNYQNYQQQQQQVDLSGEEEQQQQQRAKLINQPTSLLRLTANKNSPSRKRHSIAFSARNLSTDNNSSSSNYNSGARFIHADANSGPSSSLMKAPSSIHQQAKQQHQPEEEMTNQEGPAKGAGEAHHREGAGNSLESKLIDEYVLFLDWKIYWAEGRIRFHFRPPPFSFLSIRVVVVDVVAVEVLDHLNSIRSTLLN